MTTTLADRLLDADGALHTVLLNAIADAIAIRSDPKSQADIRATQSVAERISGDLRDAALTYAAAWHEVNGATLRADEADALTRARADIAAMTTARDEATERHRLEADRMFAAGHAAERKTWQDATCCDTPADVKAKADRWENVSRANLESIDGHRKRVEMAEREVERLRDRAETAEREVARLTHEIIDADQRPAIIDARDKEWQDRLAPLHEGFDGDGCDSGDPIDWTLAAFAMKQNAADDAAELDVARLTGAGAVVLDIVFDGPPSHDSGRFVEVEDGNGRSVNVGEWIDRGNGMFALRLAHGRAASPPPDASDEEIARALYAATAVPGAYDDLPWSVTEPRQRAGWIAAVTTVIRPRLDALRAEVDRLSGDVYEHVGAASRLRLDLAAAEQQRDALRDALTGAEAAARRGEQRADEHMGDLRAIAAHLKCGQNVDAVKKAIDNFRDGLTEAEEAWRLHEKARDVAAAERDRLLAERDLDTERFATAHRDREAAKEQIAALVDRLRTPSGVAPTVPTPSFQYIVVTRDEVNGRPASWFRTAERAETYAANCNAGFAKFIQTQGPNVWPELHHAVVDTGATPPAALPQVEAFELPAVEWSRDEDNDTDPDDETSHTAWRPGDGIRSEYASTWFEAGAVGWSLFLEGTAPDEPNARARVEAAVALLAGRAEVRR